MLSWRGGLQGPMGMPESIQPQLFTMRNSYEEQPPLEVRRLSPPPSSPPSSSLPPPRKRTNFVETWLWTNELFSNKSGEVVYEAEVPDTITSWVASAFAVSDVSGLGVAPTTSKLTVFRPFFIRLNLPYSVKRGEKFALQVLVFNYMDTEQDVTVTLKHDDGAGFDFLQKDSSVKKPISKSKGKNYNIRFVSVPGGGVSKAVYFPIVPTQIGTIKLSIIAQSAKAGDAVEQPLKVEVNSTFIQSYFDQHGNVKKILGHT
ncbi:hypothetical protein AB6A40_007008 [Gnathostoma spinigerum]|uniref:Alpha-2-macroglobulin domain-containing protein n=1 Tax=Gnathostoma spinigerum TaxID=75299 RepID=A0ABD6ESM8_9BILA